MKFETTARILRSALMATGRVIESRFTVPVLGMVLFENGTITGTDLDTEVSVTVPASSFEGAFCLPHRSLLRLVSHLAPEENIRIDVGKTGASVRFRSGLYDLPTVSPDDFPRMDMEGASSVAINGDSLKKAITFAAPFSSNEETRYYMMGVCLDGDVAVATDGARLARFPLGFDGAGFERAILTRKLVSALCAAPAPKTALINSERPTISFIMDGMRIRAKLIDGTFPDWRRVVPTIADNAPHATFERAAFTQAIRRVGAIARGRKGITLTWNASALVITGRSELPHMMIGNIRAREIMPVLTPVSGAGSASFNADFLLTVLNSLRSETVRVSLNDAQSPSVWRGDGEGFCVLMPMRANSDDQSLAAEALASLNGGEKLDDAA